MESPGKLGRYRVGAVLGRGSHAVVHRAEVTGEAGFRRAVAIKQLRPELLGDPARVEALLREAEVARRLSHGNLVQLVDVGRAGGGGVGVAAAAGAPYLVFELVDGVALAEVLAWLERRGQRLAPGQALAVAERVLDALDYVHRVCDETGRPIGAVHRDVKPANVLVSRDGVVKLADFGLARAFDRPGPTAPGIIKGTLGYMAPEQAAGRPLDGRADVYAVGVVLWQMVVGHHPLGDAEGDLARQLARIQRGVPPVPIEAAGDGELAALIDQACAVDPARRFARAGALRDALEAYRGRRGLRSDPVGLGAVVREVRAGVEEGGAEAAAAPAVRRLDDRLAAILGHGDGGGGAVGRTTVPAADRGTGAGESREGAQAAQRGRLLLIGLLGAAAVGVLFLWWQWPRGRETDARSAALQESAARQVARADAATEPPAPVAADIADAAPAARAPDASPERRHHRRHRAHGAASAGDRAASSAPAAAPGRIKVNVLPWAEVRLDGRAVGRTPLELSVGAGRHTLELHNPDTGRTSRRALAVAAGAVVVVASW